MTFYEIVKFESDAVIGQKGALCKGLEINPPPGKLFS